MKKSYATILGGAIAMVALSGVAITANAAYPTEKSPEQIMRANCGSCHGQQGEGGTSWVDPSQRAFNIAGRSARSIKRWTRDGRLPEMPAFPAQEISDNELTALANYINKLPGSYIPEPTVVAATVTITDEDPWYNPMQIRVEQGQTVKFHNVGRTYHPVTQLEYAANGNDPTKGTDSGLLGSSRSSTLYGVYYRTFNELVGTKVTFLCKIHPYMRGEVYVGANFTPPPYHVDPPMALPAVKGTGEVWVEAQFQDMDKNGNGSYADDKDGVVQVINAATWQITHMIPATNNPHNIWLGKGNAKVMLTNWFDNVVDVVDAGTKKVLGSYIAGASPAHVNSDFAGDNWYVTIEGSNYVQSFSQSRMSMNARATVSGFGPHGIWYGGGKIATSNSMDNTHSIIDAATMTELARMDTGLYPLGAGINTTGTLSAAGNCIGGSASIYDTVGMRHIRDIPLLGCGVQAPFSPDDKYIVVPNSPYTTIIDAAKAADPVGTPNPADAIVATIWTGKGAHGAAFGPKSGGGTYAYITHKYENYVAVIDMTTMTRVGDVPLNTTTTGKVAIAGAATDTGGNGIATNPNPAPWQ